MTRDEAIKKVTALLWGRRLTMGTSNDAEARATEAVDIAIALGLKLDAPKTMEQEAALWIVGRAFVATYFDGKRACLGEDGAYEVINRLRDGGFKIVRSD